MKPTALMLLCFLILTGCSPITFQDINNRFFVLAIGVDNAEDASSEYTVTAKIAIPSLKPDSKKNSYTIKASADSIPYAINKLVAMSNKKLDFSQVKVVLLGKSLTKKDISSPLDWFVRFSGIQQIAYMGLADPKASEILSTEFEAENYAGEALINSLSGDVVFSSYLRPELLFDFYARLNEKGLDPYLPVIQVIQKKIDIDHIALFDKKKLKLILEPKETQIYNILVNKLDRSSILTIGESLPKSLVVYSNSAKYSLRMVNEQQTVNWKIHLKGALQQAVDSTNQMNTKSHAEQWEQLFEKEATNLLYKLRNAGVDPIGLGLKYRSLHFKKDQDWLEWEKLYPNVLFEVNVRSDLTTGTLK